MILAVAMTMKQNLSEMKIFNRQRLSFYAISLPMILLAALVYNQSAATLEQSGLINSHPAYLSTAEELGWSAEYVVLHQKIANLKPFADYTPGM